MNLKNFTIGTNILGKYFRIPDGYHLGADHDIIYVYGTDMPVSHEDFVALKSLGWFQDGLSDDNDPYDLDASWCALV